MVQISIGPAINYTASYKSIIADAIGAHIERQANQVIPTNTDTYIQFDTEIKDDANFWAPGDNTKLYAPNDGLYVITTSVDWESQNSGYRCAYIHVNGGTVAGHLDNYYDVRLVAGAVVKLTSGDFVQVQVRHNRGWNINIEGAWIQMVLICGGIP